MTKSLLSPHSTFRNIRGEGAFKVSGNRITVTAGQPRLANECGEEAEVIWASLPRTSPD